MIISLWTHKKLTSNFYPRQWNLLDSHWKPVIQPFSLYIVDPSAPKIKFNPERFSTKNALDTEETYGTIETMTE